VFQYNYLNYGLKNRKEVKKIKRKVLVFFTLILLITLNFNVFAAEYKTIKIDNVTVSSANGSNINNEYIPIGATCKVSDLDFSGLTISKKEQQDINVLFYKFDGNSSYQSVLTIKVNFENGQYKSFVKNDILKNYDVTHIKVGVNQYSPVYNVTLNGSFKVFSDDFIPPKPEPPKEKFSVVTKNMDYDNNVYKFVFNKDFTVNLADIEFKDSKGNNVAFTHSVTNKELVISPTSKLASGTYTIKVKKVTSLEKEELTNISMSLLIQNKFYLTGKDFSNFISTDTKELNLQFNKDIVVNSISLGSLTVTKTVDKNKLKITLPTLAEETDYPLSIKVTSTDNEVLELSYGLTTKSITGNKELDAILSPILSMFETSKVNGILIIITAISIGVIFVAGKWIWGIAKEWLKKAK